MDIASLGIEVRSEEAAKGAADLDKLAGSAKRAETATRSLAGGAKATSAANAAVSSSANSAAVALNREAVAATKTSAALVAANSNVRRMGGSFSGLGAQFQDIGVTAAMGMNPAIIALQQGTQIAGQMEMAMQGGASATGVLATAFKSLFSPLTFITIALTALAAVGLQMVDWPGLAASALTGLASVLQTIAPYAVAAAAALALLYAPAIIGGVVSLIALLGRLAVSAVIAAAAMAAANPALAFVIGITAAVAAANIFRDELTRIFGVDIVGAAKDGVNAVIGFFVGGYQGIVAAWGSLPSALGDIAIQAANRVLDVIQQMVRSAVTTINSVIASANGKLRALGVRLPMLENRIPRPQIDNPYAGAAAGVGSGIADAIASAQSVDYVGNFGSAISNAASGAADKLKGLAGSFGSVEEAAGKAGAGGKEALKGIGDEAKKTAEDVNKGLVKGFLSDLRQGLAKGEGFFRSFGNAALNVLNKIVDKIETQLVDALFSLGKANSGGGGGGFLGGIFGFIGNLFGFAKGGYTGNGSASAAAGIVHGGEYVFSKRATDRIGVGNLDRVHRAAKGYASGGHVAPAANNNQPRPVNINVTVNGARGNQEIQAMVASGVRQGIAQYDRGIPGRIGDVMERNG